MARIKTSINVLETEDKQARRYRNNSLQKNHNNKKPKNDFRDNIKYANAYFKELNIKRISINGLNPRAMRKNAEKLHMVMMIFPDIIPRRFVQKHSLKNTTTTMETHPSGNIFINPDFYKKGHPIQRVRKHYGKRYGEIVANTNYTSAHEYGHIVNSRLIKKAYKHTTSSDDFYNKTTNDWNNNRFATALIAECLVGLANTDSRIQNALQCINYNAGNQVIQLNKIKNALSMKPSKLLKALYYNGFTSEYGSSDTGELYAEAFADYCWYAVKSEKADTLYKNLTLNPLSKLIIQKSHLLWTNETEMNNFRVRHRYPTQQLQTTVKPKQQSLTSKGGLTK